MTDNKIEVPRIVPRLLDVQASGSWLSVSRSTVYELIRSGQLPVVRIGRAVRISQHALEDYVARLESEQGS